MRQIEFDRFVLDLGRERLLRDGAPVKLRPQSFRMLHYLVQNAGRLLTKSELMKALWAGSAVTDDSLVQCLRDVRLALDDRDHSIVRTVPTRGYLFALRPRLSSIAVLPFVDLSRDSEKVEYLADGLSEELINVLGHTPGLKVASRSSSFRFRGKAHDVADLGRQLNVGTILEGSVRHSGDQLRVSVQLVNTADAYNIWSETYDRRMGDLISIQDEIATSIVRSLSLYIGGDQAKPVVKPRTNNPQAYHHYLTGRYFWNRRTRSAFEKAIEHWQLAIACDPDCALAYSGIADTYALLGYYGYKRPSEAYAEGKTAARKAIEIDQSLAEPHASLGELTLHFQLDLETCEHELRTAVALNPRYTRAHHNWSHYWISIGNVERSFEASRRALDLDPMNLPLIAHMCWHHYHASEFDLAIAAGEQAIEMDASFSMARIYLGRAYALNRMYKEAIREFDKSLPEGGTDVKGYLGLAFALAGDHGNSERVVAELIADSAATYVPAYHLGAISLALGDTERAFEWLNKSVEEHGRHVAAFKLDPALASIRQDPRFWTLLQKAERFAGVQHRSNQL